MYGTRNIVAESGSRIASIKPSVASLPMSWVGWCTVVQDHGSGLQRVVGSHGAPETQAQNAPWLPLAHAEALDASADWVPQLWRDMDTTLAAAPLGDAGTAVLLGRPGGPVFRPSEVARLGYLAGIVNTIVK